MGKKKAKGGDAWEDPEVLAEQISKTEQFFKDHKSLVAIIATVVVVLVGGFAGWRIYSQKQNQEAQAEMFQAQFYFEQDSLNLALRGDGNNLGFVTITQDYPNTAAGNLANFYVGAIYVKQGNYDLAKFYLQDFSSNDLLVQARAYSLLGDISMEEADYSTAIEYYNKAANYKPNKEFTPVYLKKAAVAYEKQGDLDGAKKAYKRIIDEFWDSTEYPDARKHFARLGGTES